MAYSEGEAVFFKKSASVREYVQHFANVLSGELAKPRRRPKVLQKSERRWSMCCILRTYFRGGLVSDVTPKSWTDY